MDTGAKAAVPPSKSLIWTGRIISGLIVLFLLSTSVMGIVKSAEFIPQFVRMGYPASAYFVISTVFIICICIYAIPRTAVLGAVLLTGYLGGATATHVRIGEPFYFPVAVGVLVWLGLFLREERLRALLPWRSGN